jgi:NAD(P)-dependent dehydrogenase (short-subunit alcohol dehydrogenase family)
MLVHLIDEPIICTKILCRHWQTPSALVTPPSLSALARMKKPDQAAIGRDWPHLFRPANKWHLVHPLPMPIAIVTGASRGLGFENAKGLAAQGYDLVMVAKDQGRLSLAQQSLKDLFPDRQISTYAVDLEDLTATRAATTQIAAEHSAPDVLILAHGVMSEKMSRTLRTNDEEWRRVMAINLDSVFILVNGLVPSMAEARKGRVIIYSACLGRMSGPGNAGGLAPYRISKAGVNAMVRNLAHETGLGARGLLVDAVCPNHSQTDMGGPDAPRTAEEGAACALWLATREFNAGDITGVLWEDNQIVEW